MFHSIHFTPILFSNLTKLSELYVTSALNSLFIINRSSHQEVFCKKDVLRNFVNFTGKHLCHSLFFNRVAAFRPATLLKKRLWFTGFAMNFAKFPRTSLLQNTSWWLLLYKICSNHCSNIFHYTGPCNVWQGHKLANNMQTIRYCGFTQNSCFKCHNFPILFPISAKR